MCAAPVRVTRCTEGNKGLSESVRQFKKENVEQWTTYVFRWMHYGDIRKSEAGAHTTHTV